jgi:hypothetical protein
VLMAYLLLLLLILLGARWWERLGAGPKCPVRHGCLVPERDPGREARICTGAVRDWDPREGGGGGGIDQTLPRDHERGTIWSKNITCCIIMVMFVSCEWPERCKTINVTSELRL